MEREKLVKLVASAQRGDQTALNDLFNAFYNDVYYFALKTVKDDELACDITQETFIEIINTIGSLNEPAAFVKWMKQITYHQCTRYFKKKKEVIVDEDEEGNNIFDTLKEDSAEFIPDEALDKTEFKKTIMAMLDELSEEQRAAVMMFYFDELSVKQIAEIQGVSENTVKSRLNYARKDIKKAVEEYEMRTGVKLHSAGVLPILLWLFKDYFAKEIPASAARVAEGITAATGTSVAVGASATATAATAAATTTAVGLGAKLASLPLVTKIVGCIVAATVTVGGITTAVVVSNKDEPAYDNSEVVWQESESIDQNEQEQDVPIDYSFISDFFEENTAEQALMLYGQWLGEYELPYFESVDEIAVDDAVRYGVRYWAGVAPDGSNVRNITTVEYQKVLLKSMFGREFDFAQITGKFVQRVTPEDASKNETYLQVDCGGGAAYKSSSFLPMIDNGDGTYSIMFAHVRDFVQELPEGIQNGEYGTEIDENGNFIRYHIYHHSVKLTVEKSGNGWVMKSYEEMPMIEWIRANGNAYGYVLDLEGVIPFGCTYTRYDGTVLKAGDKFPEVCTAGDVVDYGDYIYGFECVNSKNIEGTDYWHMWKDGFDDGDSGLIESDAFGAWSVMVKDQTKESYGIIASTINGKPIKTLYATFFGCTNMIESPWIPRTITAMTSTYYGCTSLETAPEIPSNVERIMMTFYGCTALKGNISINAALDKSLSWYYTDTFSGTGGDITLVGDTDYMDLLLIARSSDNPNIKLFGEPHSDIIN